MMATNSSEILNDVYNGMEIVQWHLQNSKDQSIHNNVNRIIDLQSDPKGIRFGPEINNEHQLPDVSNLDMLEYQLRQKERLRNRQSILQELFRIKKKERSKPSTFLKSDLQNSVIKAIKRHKGRYKNLSDSAKTRPFSSSFTNVKNSIKNQVQGHGLSSNNFISNDDDGINIASMLQDMIGGIDFLGIFGQAYNAALPLLNIGTRLGLGIGVDVFNEIDSSDTNSQALTIQNQALSRSDFIPELEHWFRRTIWFLGFSAVWTLSPSLAIITVVLAASYEAIRFLAPSLQQRRIGSDTVGEYIGGRRNDDIIHSMNPLHFSHIFSKPKLGFGTANMMGSRKHVLIQPISYFQRNNVLFPPHRKILALPNNRRKFYLKNNKMFLFGG